MALLRFNLDLAIPEDPAGTLVAGVKINSLLAQKIPDIRDAIRGLKSYATKINAGQLNEEITVKASWHICHHDDPTVGGLYPLGKPCEPEREI